MSTAHSKHLDKTGFTLLLAAWERSLLSAARAICKRKKQDFNYCKNSEGRLFLWIFNGTFQTAWIINTKYICGHEWWRGNDFEGGDKVIFLESKTSGMW